MKIYLDTANIDAIKKYIATGLIDGITTNPTHLSKESGDLKKHILEICSLLPHGFISVQATEHEPNALYAQAKKIAALAPNVIVKIPCAAQYYSVIQRLVKEGIALNITLVFTVPQALFMSKLGVRIISPFIGRWDDNGADGIELLTQIRAMLDTYDFPTELLAASIRSVQHMNQALLVGADSITLPIPIFEQAMKNVLTDQGMQTFDADWNKLGIKQFP